MELRASENLQEIGVEISNRKLIFSDVGEAQVLRGKYEQKRSVLLLLNFIVDFLAVLEILDILRFQRSFNKLLLDLDVQKALTFL